jgi:hypothetical protein
LYRGLSTQSFISPELEVDHSLPYVILQAEVDHSLPYVMLQAEVDHSLPYVMLQAGLLPVLLFHPEEVRDILIRYVC